MYKRFNLIKKLEKFKHDLLDVIPVNKMILFGSFASGNPHKYSDIDLIIVSKKFKGVKSYRRSLELYKFWNLEYPVDFLCYTPEEFNRFKCMITIVREAIKKGTIIK